MEYLHIFLSDFGHWLNDVTEPLVILICIRTMYMLFDTREAQIYMGNQFSIFYASSVSCITVLELYYQFLQLNNLDDNGLILACFLTAGGLLCNLLNEKWFKENASVYNATDEEYLFIVTITFIAVSIKMVLRGVLHVVVPAALLLGRFFWLDTKNLKSVISMLCCNHKRLIITALFYLLGMILSTGLGTNLQLYKLSDLSWACLYGIMLLIISLLFLFISTLKKWIFQKKVQNRNKP